MLLRPKAELCRRGRQSLQSIEKIRRLFRPVFDLEQDPLTPAPTRINDKLCPVKMHTHAHEVRFSGYTMTMRFHSSLSKMRLPVKLSLTVCLSVLLNTIGPVATAQAQPTHFKIAYSGFGGTQRNAFISLGYEFEQQHPDVYIKYITRDDEAFKRNLSHWLYSEDYLDAVVWNAGERLYKYVRQNQVSSITDIWEKEGLDRDFSPAMKELVTLEGEVYAIPIAYYQWGFYYKKSTFKSMGLKPAANWDEFLELMDALKKKGLSPITIGSGSTWPIAAWFEYFNLRINGMDFHRRFAAGKVSADSEEIRSVLQHWKILIDKGYFIEHHRMLNWQEALPDIYRNRVGITLLGNFVESVIPQAVVDDIGFFPFPKIKPDIADYQLAPTDVIFIPKTSRKQALAKEFIAFVAEAKNQAAFNSLFQQLPPNINARGSQSELSLAGRAMLENADGLTQYFDRDAEQIFAREMMDIWIDFLEHADIDRAVRAMDQARTHLLSRGTLVSDRN